MYVTTIPMINVALAFIPVLVVLVVMFWWSLPIGDSVVAVGRMLIQLVVIGYALIWIFEVDSPLLVLGLLSTMLLIASSIALRPLAEQRTEGDYARALLSIACGGGLTLAFMTYFILTLDPWYQANIMIPLAGMIFASSMNVVSVAACLLYTSDAADE